MKKLAIILVIAISVLCFTGCEEEKEKTTSSSSTSSSSTGKTTANAKESGESKMKEDSKANNKYAEVTNNPVVTMEMEDGGIVKMELYPQIAPTTVENFISLIKSGYYDGLTFHRVMPQFMAQGGDPKGNGTGGPGYSIEGEFSDNGFTQNTLKHDIGVVSMARAKAPDSAGSQFFIVTNENSYISLDGLYAGFGKVIEGMDEVYKIVKSEVYFTSEEYQNMVNDYYAGTFSEWDLEVIELINSGIAADMPKEPPKIKTMTVDTFGVEYDEPKKITE